MRKIALCLFVIFFLNGCINNTLHRLSQVGDPPKLDKVIIPQDRMDYQYVNPKKAEDKLVQNDVPINNKIHKANSLWDHNTRSFFKDPKSSKIGDIVKVKINVSDKAALSNKSSRKRQTAENFLKPKVFNLQDKLLNPSNDDDGGSLLSLNGNNNNLGSGAIDRSENITTEIAAIITEILDNGNLVISGKQEIEVNYELRQISIKGIARPEDITSDNAIDSSKIAELRLVYGGEGHLSDVQQPRVATQFIDILSPF